MAIMRAARLVFLARCRSAAWPFVGSVGTVRFSVADRGNIDTALCNSGTQPLAMLALEHGCTTSVPVVFVRVVSAVVLPVANPGLEDALGVVAFEVVLWAFHLATGGRLITGILAVWISIAEP
uniref:Secreted protein n=1 Tax=Ixodes ricinus TaxID=34613 RepID=A0A6B0UP28_IXORI